MDKADFKKFCHEVFSKYGFRKYRSKYYQESSHGLLCCLTLEGSSYGGGYYIGCDYFIGNYHAPIEYPSQYEFDLADRPILVLSKTTYKGEYFLTGLIEYEKYTAEELSPYFDQAFETRIMPPLLNGKVELLQHIDDWHFPPCNIKSKEEVLDKLRC